MRSSTELQAGRLVQLLVSNFPQPELNHTVVVFESHPKKGAIDFVVWDPNNPDGPGIIHCSTRARGASGRPISTTRTPGRSGRTGCTTRDYCDDVLDRARRAR